jgi:hypothetical protein
LGAKVAKWLRAACGKNHLRSGSGRDQSVRAFSREGFPKNFSFGEGFADDIAAGKHVRSGTNEKVKAGAKSLRSNGSG